MHRFALAHVLAAARFFVVLAVVVSVILARLLPPPPSGRAPSPPPPGGLDAPPSPPPTLGCLGTPPTLGGLGTPLPPTHMPLGATMRVPFQCAGCASTAVPRHARRSEHVCVLGSAYHSPYWSVVPFLLPLEYFVRASYGGRNQSPCEWYRVRSSVRLIAWRTLVAQLIAWRRSVLVISMASRSVPAPKK